MWVVFEYSLCQASYCVSFSSYPILLLGMVSHPLVMTYFIFPRTCDTCLEPHGHWPPVKFNFTHVHKFTYKYGMCLFEVDLTPQPVSVCFPLANPFGFLTPSLKFASTCAPFSTCVYFHKIIRFYNSILVNQPICLLFWKINKILN